MLSARNTLQTYGWVSILLHWIMAIALLGMYAVGTYMVELDYYDSLYHTLPNLHKSVGILLGLLLLVRLAWLYSQPRPSPANSIAPAISHMGTRHFIRFDRCPCYHRLSDCHCQRTWHFGIWLV